MTSLLAEKLQKIKNQGLYRELRAQEHSTSTRGLINHKKTILFASNDYLGLASHPDVKEAGIRAIKNHGTSASASRLISGNHKLYKELEARIAALKGKQSALIFPTGYMANLGFLSTIASSDDIIYTDKLNHASIYDACQLTKAAIQRYRHKNIQHLKGLLENKLDYRQRFIITDSVFSMDGDIAPLKGLKELADEYNCQLVVDDAHGTGVLGKNGQGAASLMRVEVKNEIGTLSKAIGCLGGFIAGSNETIDYLINKSRPFMFTTALPPAVLASTICSIDLLRKENWRQKRVLDLAQKARSILGSAGYSVPESITPIIPLIIGDEKKALSLADKCLAKGIFIPAIRTPAVPKSQARLRMTVSTLHTDEELDLALDILISSGKELNIIE